MLMWERFVSMEARKRRMLMISLSKTQLDNPQLSRCFTVADGIRKLTKYVKKDA